MYYVEIKCIMTNVILTVLVR